MLSHISTKRIYKSHNKANSNLFDKKNLKWNCTLTRSNERTTHTHAHARTRTHARTFIGKINLELSIILDTTLSIILYTGCVYYPGHTLSNKMGTRLAFIILLFTSNKGNFNPYFLPYFLPFQRAEICGTIKK